MLNLQKTGIAPWDPCNRDDTKISMIYKLKSCASDDGPRLVT